MVPLNLCLWGDVNTTPSSDVRNCFYVFSITRAWLIEDGSWNIILLPLLSLLPFFLFSSPCPGYSIHNGPAMEHLIKELLVRPDSIAGAPSRFLVFTLYQKNHLSPLSLRKGSYALSVPRMWLPSHFLRNCMILMDKTTLPLSKSFLNVLTS